MSWIGAAGVTAGAAVALGLSAVGSASSSSPLSERAGNARSVQQPNIVLIVTDDQTAASLSPRVMPHTTRLLVERGATFTDAIVTTPACCPSRATILTGQYGHNNGVRSNSDGYKSLRSKRNTLPVWVRRAGYRTAHVGKYPNGYAAFAGRGAVAPGWSEWRSIPGPFAYYGYRLAINGRVVKRGRSDRAHLTRTLNRHAVRIIRRFAPRKRPLYLQLDHFAPHRGSGRGSGRCQVERSAVPDPRDEQRFRDEPLPIGPSFNEADVSDKPAAIQVLPPADAGELRRAYRCDLAALRGVDRGVRRVVEALRRAGELDQTAILFTSDNGLLYGEHRVRRGKLVPYEEALRVPLIARIPREYRGGADRVPLVGEPVANLDIAPTILDLAGGAPCRGDGCRVLDGRSLLPLLAPGDSEWPAERAILIELAESRDDFVGPRPCEYEGVRVGDRIYVEYARSLPALGPGLCAPTQEIEHYDLSVDPQQLQNRHPLASGTPSSQQALELQARLEALRDCAGIAGRDPAPPGGAHCE